MKAIKHKKGRCHESHKTEFVFDSEHSTEYCVNCLRYDTIGSWGDLANPCLNPKDKPLIQVDEEFAKL